MRSSTTIASGGMEPVFEDAGYQPLFQADDRNRQNGLLYEANKPTAPGAKKSAQFDFSHANAANAEVLNEILREDAANRIKSVAGGVEDIA